MTRARFEELVADALDLVPERFAREMDNVVVLVEDRDPEDPTLLGLYFGVALTEREDSGYAGVLPDRITIYREPVLQMCDSEQEVVDEVAITVVHEIAHHFGIDDETLHSLGWGCAAQTGRSSQCAQRQPVGDCASGSSTITPVFGR